VIGSSYGSDSGGGAGIQADIKTVTQLDGFAMTAVTALTAQNSLGVHGVHEVPEEFIAQQIQLVLEDFGADCLKTGMLHSRPVIQTVCESLDRYGSGIKLVADPVMVAKGGHPLLQPEAMAFFKETMLSRAYIITPNIPEAEALTGQKITSIADMEAAGEALVRLGAQAALIKGGHMSGAVLTDVLVQLREGAYHCAQYSSDRIESRNTHGTGCTLASAIAASLAQERTLEEAVERARAYVLGAIATAPGYGQGHGPLNHAYRLS